jgi:hypothetical protein
MSKNSDFNTKNLTSISSGIPGARYRVKAVFESMVLGLLQDTNTRTDSTKFRALVTNGLVEALT